MDNLFIDIINYINGFLQRTDQNAWKITSKYYLHNLIYNIMNLNSELNLYTKTIDELDYAWKDNTKYININYINNYLSHKYDLLKKFAVLSDLWYFDFNAEFNVFYGEYRILFLTSVSDFVINIEHINLEGIITKSTHNHNQNKIKIKFDSVGKIKVNCREINKLKHNKTVQYIMCIPEYYWNKIYNCEKKLFDWKKQIICTNNSDNKIIRNFL